MKNLMFAALVVLVITGCKIHPNFDSENPSESKSSSNTKTLIQTPPSTLSNDFPRQGFVHKVKKGESVESIARKYNSRTDWIIRANLIADPAEVGVGTDLFVPQK